MVNGRNIFTYLANIFMLSLSLLLFLTITNGTLCFRVLTIVCLAFGGCTTLYYFFVIKEKTLSEQAIKLDQAYKAKMKAGEMLNVTNMEKKENQGKSPTDWLKECQFYLFAFVYAFARLALNANATMMPFYLITVLGFQPAEQGATSPQIALVPLITYSASLIFTVIAMKKVTQHFANRFIPMFGAAIICTIGALPLLFLKDNSLRYIVLPCAIFLGVGIALMLNTGTSLISDVLGADVKSAAFVYGAYSLLDKFANGFLLYWLVAEYSESPKALPWIISMVPIISAFGCAIFTLIGLKLYSAKLQKISVGSHIAVKKKQPKAM